MDLQHDIYDFLRDEELLRLEEYIVACYQDIKRSKLGRDHPDYELVDHLLLERQWKIDHAVRDRQRLLYDDLDACNRTLYWVTRQSYDKAHEIWDKMPLLHETHRLKLLTFIDGYPKLHPVQDELRTDLWGLLTEPLHSHSVYNGHGVILGGVSISRREDEPFDDVVGMQEQFHYSWNEGFDRELTAPLHLNSPFHHLYDHTIFAITDFLFARDFYMRVHIEEERSNDDEPCLLISDEDLAEAYKDKNKR